MVEMYDQTGRKAVRLRLAEEIGAIASPGLLTQTPEQAPKPSQKPVALGVPAAVAMAVGDWISGKPAIDATEIAAKVKARRGSGLLVDVANHVAGMPDASAPMSGLADLSARELTDGDLADLGQVAASLSDRKCLAPAEALVEAAWSVSSNRRQPLIMTYGLIMVAAQRPADALEALKRSAADKPDDATAWFNLALVYVFLSDYEQAWPSFRRALELSPGNPRIKASYGLALLTAGQPEQAWPLYEGRMALPDQRKRHNQPTSMWHGGPYPGETLFVYGEQGFGDFIQFARYLPMVKALGGRLVVGCRKPLIPLLSEMDCIDAVVAFEPGSQTPKHDLRVPVLSLAQYVDPRFERTAMAAPYLSAPARKGLPRAGKTPRIGLAWGCSPTGSGAAFKRVPTELLAPLMAIKGPRWFSLQFEADVNAELATVPFGDKINQSLSGSMASFGDAAANLTAMDLIITTDTATAHLAGAMDKPAWVLLQRFADWRWGVADDTMPWYPSLRLFRLEQVGAWQPLIGRVSAGLEVWLKDWHTSRKKK